MPGYFAVQVDLPGPGIWTFLATMRDKGRLVAGKAATEVKAHAVAAIGSKALSEATPVAATPAEAAKIDTRDPPTPMHYISLDAALRNGLPTVVVFATPLLCTSRMCGPVVHEVLDVYDKVGAKTSQPRRRRGRSATPTSRPPSTCDGGSTPSRGSSSSTRLGSFGADSRGRAPPPQSRQSSTRCSPTVDQ